VATEAFGRAAADPLQLKLVGDRKPPEPLVLLLDKAEGGKCRVIADDRQAFGRHHSINASPGFSPFLLVHIEEGMPLGLGQRRHLMVRAIAPDEQLLALTLDMEGQVAGVWPEASTARMPGATSPSGFRKVIRVASGTTVAWNSMPVLYSFPSGGAERRSLDDQKSYSTPPIT
jgi:hypothetical protein